MFTVDDILEVNVVVKDKHGNAAKLDGLPVFETDRPDLITIEQDTGGDGLRAKITPLGGIGAPVVTLKGDGDLGDGVAPFELMGVLDLTGGAAASGTMTFTKIG